MTIKKQNIIKHKNVLPRIKMSKEVLTFRDIEIEKKNYCNKTPTFLKDVAIEQVLVSNKIYFGEKKYTLLITCTIIIKLSHYV